MHVMAIKAIVRLRQSRKLGGTPGDDSVKRAILKPVYRGVMGSSRWGKEANQMLR